MNDQDPRQVLARRLRALREERWPGKRVKQSQLAAALGGVGNRPASVPLISSWESPTNPKVPPAARIQDIATFYASPRSLDGEVGRLLRLDEMTAEEQAARKELLEELTSLRSRADGAPALPQPREMATPGNAGQVVQSLDTNLYRFTSDQPITVVCAQLPQEMRTRMPYSDPLDPDFIKLYGYSDLDSLLELFGHLRAANPTSRVQYLAAGQLRDDDYTDGHLVSLGGVDWNEATSSLLGRLQLPVRQVTEWGTDKGAYFEVTEADGRKSAYRPVLEKSGKQVILREDVALFAWAVSPFNQKRFVTICNGMYGRGTYGAVRALTDELFRDRNMGYVRAKLANSEAFCILTRVTVLENGLTLTPDWTLPDTRLFEWSRPK